MKKIYPIFMGITFLMAIGGCTQIVARKDKEQIIEFQNENIKKGSYEITFYKLYYPNTSKEQDKFFDEFKTLASKMLVHNENTNIIIPLEFYNDIKDLKNNEVRKGEKVFYTQASLLTNEEKKLINDKIKVDTPKNTGEIQKYLNKQIAFWYSYLGEIDNYNPNEYYTELDKNIIINRVLDKRKKDMNVIWELEKNFVLAVDNIQENINEIVLPLYFEKNYNLQNLSNLKSKVILLNSQYSNITIPNKLILIANGTTTNVKGYKIESKIKNINSPLDIINYLFNNKKETLNIADMKNFTIKKVENVKSHSPIITNNPAKRETLKFKTNEESWVLE